MKSLLLSKKTSKDSLMVTAHSAKSSSSKSTWSTVERVVVDCSVWLRRNKRCSLYALCLKGLPRDVSATLAKYLNGSDPEPLRGQRSPGLIVSLVKAALEHLHAPLVSGDLYEKFMSVHEIRNAQRRVKMLQTLVDLVPPQQLGVLRTLMALLSDIYTFETQDFPSTAVQTVRSIASHFEDFILRPTGHVPSGEEKLIASVVTCILIQEYRAIFEGAQQEPSQGRPGVLQDVRSANVLDLDPARKPYTPRGPAHAGEENHHLRRENSLNSNSSTTTSYETASSGVSSPPPPRTPPSPRARAARGAAAVTLAAAASSPPEINSSPNGTARAFGGIPKSPLGAGRLARSASDGLEDSFLAPEALEELDALCLTAVQRGLFGPSPASSPLAPFLPRAASGGAASLPSSSSRGAVRPGTRADPRRPDAAPRPSTVETDPLSLAWLEPRAKAEILKREIAQEAPGGGRTSPRSHPLGYGLHGTGAPTTPPPARSPAPAAPLPSPRAAQVDAGVTPITGPGARIIAVPIAHLKRYEDCGLQVTVGPERFVISGAYLKGPSVSTLTYDQLREEKTVLKRELKKIDDDFTLRAGRKPSKTEKEVLRSWYIRYFKLKTSIEKHEQLMGLHAPPS